MSFHSIAMKLFGVNSYCNPGDLRDFIFASSTNDRLGVLPNLARGRAKQRMRQFAISFALVLLPCLALYLYNRAFYPIYMVVLLGGLWIRSRYFKRLAKEDLAACPGPRGPRDGVGREASAERVVWQLMGWLCIPIALIVLVAIGMAVVKKGLPPKNEIMALIFVLLMITAAFSLLIGASAFYFRARGRMKWGLLLFGAIWFPVSVLVLKSNLLDRSPAEPCEGELVRLESEGSLVRIGMNPARYVGVKNGEKLYYVLEGDTLKRISAEEAESYAK